MLMKENPDYDPMMNKPNNEDDLGDIILLSAHKYSRSVINEKYFGHLGGIFIH